MRRRLRIGMIGLLCASWSSSAGDANEALREMVSRDQADLRRFSETIVENGRELRRILESRGWPHARVSGPEASADAAVLWLHAEGDRALQLKCLALMRSAARTGGASLSDIAYLIDKLAVNRGDPQTFGSQGYLGEDGCWHPKRLARPSKADDYRRRYGLPPLAAYRSEMNAGLPSCRAARGE